ncbi:MAG: methyltransferase domain-containing protein [archaeon]
MNLDDYLKKEGIEETTMDPMNLFKSALKEQDYKLFEEVSSSYMNKDTIENAIKLYDFFVEKNLTTIKYSLVISEIKKVMPIVLKEIPEHEKILDIGCNDGLKTIYYAMSFPNSKFVGLDISPLALEYAKNKANEYECKNIEFIEENMLSMDYDKEFDLVLMDHVLQDTSCFDSQLGQDFMLLEKLNKSKEAMTDDGEAFIAMAPNSLNDFNFQFTHLINEVGFESIKSDVFWYTKFGVRQDGIFYLVKKKN